MPRGLIEGRWKWGAVVALTLCGAACRRAEEEPPPPADAHAPSGETCPSWASSGPASLEPLPTGPYVETFEAAWDLVRRRHPDPTLRCLPWVALRQSYGEKVATAITRAEAYGYLNDLLATLNESHLHAWPPAATRPRLEGEGPVGQSAARFVLDGDTPRMAGAQARAGGYAGAAIRAVDGVDLETLRARAVHQSPAMREEAKLRAALDDALRCRVGQERALTVVVGEGLSATSRELGVSCAPHEGARVSLGHLRRVPTQVRAQMIPGTQVGVLAFNVWMLPMLPEIRRGLSSLRSEGMRQLLIDLRGNPGGVGSMVMPMGRMLMREDASLGELVLRDHVQRLVVAGQSEAFSGPVSILVDEASASTSEIFAQGMHDLGRATVVGVQTSAGMALPSVIESLPDGGALQLVVGHHQSPSHGAPEGRGVQLDGVLSMDQGAYREHDDPVQAAAVRWMRRRNGPSAVDRAPTDHAPVDPR